MTNQPDLRGKGSEVMSLEIRDSGGYLRVNSVTEDGEREERDSDTLMSPTARIIHDQTHDKPARFA